jgi:outer membrane protein assembly complex protein YaeT
MMGALPRVVGSVRRLVGRRAVGSRCGWWWAMLVVLGVGVPQLATAKEPEPKPKPAKIKPAKLQISGFGLLGNHNLRKQVRTLQSDALKAEQFDANFIEDTALVLLARLKEDGFFRPALDVRMVLADGQKLRVRWEETITPPLNRPLSARKVQFVIKEGVRYHYRHLTFDGLTAISARRARAYFMETGVLLPLPSTRIFTPGRLRTGLRSLTDVLERMGYAEARATASDVELNNETGAVNVRVRVEQGLKSMVGSVRVETSASRTNEAAEVRTVYPNKPYSREWVQDFTLLLKATNYHRGYPDTQVAMETLRREGEPSWVRLDLRARVESGPLIHVEDVRFAGAARTSPSVMDRSVPLESGELLDPTKAEQGRTRLTRLGVFESVRLRYEEVTPEKRDVIYDVTEAKPFEINLLAGYGSYELLRGGFELEQKNVFGLAHRARLRAIQSFKSSRGEFTYTMPELLGERLDVFLNGFGLRREEVSFIREEYGGGIGVHRYFTAVASDLSVRYNYQVLNATDAETNVVAESPVNPGVGAIIMDFRHDRRDNPLYPHRGYKIFTTFELASEYLAGDVNYQRLELAASYHLPLGGGRQFNFGLSHGLVATVGETSENLPFNKRFFPGGEYSIRGYQDGEAAPRNATGDIVGAETYLFGSVEFEQALTPKWAVVVFSDSIGFAKEFRDYPGDESLYSVGGGIRWRTIVGPVRVEYGHNLNPRPKDPSGTLHFSLGFPF